MYFKTNNVLKLKINTYKKATYLVNKKPHKWIKYYFTCWSKLDAQMYPKINKQIYDNN